MMIGHQFYPTPQALARRMVQAIPKEHLTGGKVLEPSAGKGDIIREIASRIFPAFHAEPGYHDRKLHAEQYADTLRKVICCEIDPILSAGLREQGWNVTAPDFLQYGGRPDITAIVMNPPFDAGAAHVMHAWNILHEGTIVALVNSETILNPCDMRRVLLGKVIADNGRVEHLGPVFKLSERKTGVEVSMIILTKKARQESDPFFKDAQFKSTVRDEAPDEVVTDITSTDFIQHRVQVFNATIAGFEAMVPAFIRVRSLIDRVTDGFTQKDVRLQQATDEQQKVNDYIKSGGLITAQQAERMKGLAAEIQALRYKSAPDAVNMLLHCLGGIRKGPGGNNLYSSHCTGAQIMGAFRDDLTARAWDDLLGSVEMREKMSTKARDEFDKMQETQRRIDFTEENIHTLLEVLRGSGGVIVKQALLDAFDFCTRYHKDNRVHGEGWATNDAFKLRKKFIMPLLSAQWGRILSCMSIDYQQTAKFDDMDRALCHLSGKSFSKVLTLREALKDRENLQRHDMRDDPRLKDPEFDIQKGESEFFTFKWHYKGTVHIEFKDKELWEKFNYQAGIARGWLPSQTNRNNKDWRS